MERRTNGYYKHWRERERERASNAHSSKYGETFRGEIDFGIQGLQHSTVEQEDHTRKEVVKSWFSNSKRTQIEKRWKPTWWKITRITHSAKCRRTWSTAWRTWSTSRWVRSLLKFSALSVWHTGRQGSCIVHAELACISQGKHENWTGIDLMHYRFHHTWWRRVQLTARLMGTLRDTEFITQFTLRCKTQNKNGFDSMLERFQNCPIYREVTARDWMGSKHSAHTTTNFQKKIIHTCAPQKSIKDVKTDGDWYSTAKIKRSDATTWCLRRNHQNLWAIVRRVWRRTKSIPANKYGKERINRSQDSVKEPNELTRKLDGDGILLLPHQARLRHGGNHQTNGGRHRVVMNSLKFSPNNSHWQGVSLASNGDSLVSDGEV